MTIEKKNKGAVNVENGIVQNLNDEVSRSTARGNELAEVILQIGDDQETLLGNVSEALVAAGVLGQKEVVPGETSKGVEISIAPSELLKPTDLRDTVKPDEAKIKPIGKGVFGDIYDQFKGKIKDALPFLLEHKSGDLLGVFHRDGFGDIDLVWGGHERHEGLEHIIVDHVVNANDFDNIEEMMDIINDVINNGTPEKLSSQDKTTFVKDNYRVSVKKQYRDENGNVQFKKNWVVTAFDTKRKEQSKKRNKEESDAKWKEMLGNKKEHHQEGL